MKELCDVTMTTKSFKILCAVCEELLDKRDIVKSNIVCWKCGWKKPAINVLKREDREEEDLDIWLDNMFESIMYPYD